MPMLVMSTIQCTVFNNGNTRNMNVWLFLIQCWKVQLVKVHHCAQA